MAQQKPLGTAKAASWAETSGTGGRKGAWGIGGALGSFVAYSGTILLIVLCPAITIFMCVGYCLEWPIISHESWLLAIPLTQNQAVS